MLKTHVKKCIHGTWMLHFRACLRYPFFVPIP